MVITKLLTTSPVVSWRGWETPLLPPKHHDSTVILCMTSSGGQQGGRKGHPTYSLVSIRKNGVLLQLKHIFPNTYQRIKSIRSLAKVGTGCYRFKYQPGSTLEGVGDTPPNTAAQLSFFACPRARSAGREVGPSHLFFGKY